MRVKVHNGTASGSEASLCQTCRHSTIIRGRTLDEEIVHCQISPMSTTRVTFKVTSCSGYNDERLPTYMQLLEDAWILQPGTKRRPAGFVRASELREEELSNIMRDLHKQRDE
ncbi:MAG TPA: hypothetical protein VK886_01225 [Vicinamibacterales bacterium]|nr:hypothetical protein [Vicinamibacterales bacterium]